MSIPAVHWPHSVSYTIRYTVADLASLTCNLHQAMHVSHEAPWRLSLTLVQQSSLSSGRLFSCSTSDQRGYSDRIEAPKAKASGAQYLCRQCLGESVIRCPTAKFPTQTTFTYVDLDTPSTIHLTLPWRLGPASTIAKLIQSTEVLRTSRRSASAYLSGPEHHYSCGPEHHYSCRPEVWHFPNRASAVDPQCNHCAGIIIAMNCLQF